MKIGILTYFRAINYGAYLQAYALSHRLNQEDGIEAELIDFHMPAEDEYYRSQLKIRKNFPVTLYNRKRYGVFQDALKDQILSEGNLCGKDIEEFQSFVSGRYDVIIAGSDEIWRTDGIRGMPAPYFLPGDLGCKKVAYAASGFKLSSVKNVGDLQFIEECLNGFSYIGVRERKSMREIVSLVSDNVPVCQNWDPCFVYDFKPDTERGRYLLKSRFHVSGKRKTVVVMYLGKDRALEGYLKRNFGRRYDFISLYIRNPAFRNNPSVYPSDWIDLIAAADGVISMFYHGICFAAIAGSPFYAIETRTASREESKLYDLAERMGMSGRYSLGVDDAVTKGGLKDFMDFVSDGGRIDISSELEAARKEFDDFTDMLKNLV